MTPQVSQRLAAIAESPTLRVDASAKRLLAEGRPVIGFGAGEPDFPTPEHIVEAAIEACRDPASHRYTAAAGLPELREAIAGRAGETGWPVGPDQVLVTNGGKQAIYNACAAVIDPGDEVIVPAPYWPTFIEAVRLAGGVPVPVMTDAATGYKVSVEQLERVRTARTRMLILVNPSNPTGAVLGVDELRPIGDWLVQHGLTVLTDEIYAQLVYDGVAWGSLPAVCPEVRQQCIVVGGVAKTYAMTGWRVGWMIGPSQVVVATTNLQSHTTSNVANVSQRAALAALTGPQDAVDSMRAAFDRRRRAITGMLDEIRGITCPLPSGAFYAFASVQGLLDRQYDGRRLSSSAELAEYILEKVEVAVVPGEAFGAPGHLRLSYALSDDLLAEGVARLKNLFDWRSSGVPRTHRS